MRLGSCVADCSGLLRGVYEYTGREYSRDGQLAAFGNLDSSVGGGNGHAPPSCSLDLGNIGLYAAPNQYRPDSTWSYELGTVVFDGETLGQAPWTVYASLEYQFEVGALPGFYARLIDDFKSKNNGPFLYQLPDSAVADPDLHPGPSRNQLDLRVGRVWKGVDVSLFVSNALDAHPAIANSQATHYVGYDFNSGDPVSSPIFSYSTITPRTFGITGIYNF